MLDKLTTVDVFSPQTSIPLLLSITNAIEILF
jgi:hypothetical protein